MSLKKIIMLGVVLGVVLGVAFIGLLCFSGRGQLPGRYLSPQGKLTQRLKVDKTHPVVVDFLARGHLRAEQETTRLNKMSALSVYVNEEILYSLESREEHTLSYVLEHGGMCFDMAAALQYLAAQEGIKSHLRGVSLHGVDHAVVQFRLNGKVYIMDPTNYAGTVYLKDTYMDFVEARILY